MDIESPIQSPIQSPVSPVPKKRKLDERDEPKTPDTVMDTPGTPPTPPTVKLDHHGNELPGQENVHDLHDEYNKWRKYKMVPFELPVHINNDIFIKQIDGSFRPLPINGETYILEPMSKEDFNKGIPSYNYHGEKMESGKLQFGGSKKKRSTRKKKHLKKKRRATIKRK